MATLCFSVAFNEFLSLSRRGFKSKDLAFLLLCLGGALYCVFCAGEYNVDQPLQSVPWLRAETIVLLLSGLVLLWFVSEETGLVRPVYLLICAIWALLGVLSQILPTGELSWVASRPWVQRVSLPFGATIVYREVETGILLHIIDAGGAILLGYLIVTALRYGRGGRRREARVLVTVLAAMGLAYASDAAVDAGLYSFIYVSDYAWLVLILLFAIRRSSERQEYSRTRRELLKSEARYRAVVEHSYDGIIFLDADRRISYVSPSYNRFYGFSLEELIGRPALDSVLPEDRAQAADMLDAVALRPGGTVCGEYRILTKEGALVWRETSATNLLDDPQVRSIVLNSRDVTERKATVENLKAALEEKEALLRELHHRTRNNMQVISSMISLRSGFEDDPRILEILGGLEGRIGAMALVQEKLYESGDLSSIPLDEYIADLAELLAGSCASPGRIRIATETEKVAVLIDSAIPCGIVLSELVLNSCRHAFPAGRRGVVGIRLARLEDGRIELAVEDDGVGVVEGFDPRRDGKLGLESVISIVEMQLGGSIEFEADGGFACRFRFRDSLYRARI